MAHQYKDELYFSRIEEEIQDIYYSNASYTTKISRIRTLTEFYIRRLIQHHPDSKLELGNEKTIKALQKKNICESFFWDAYNKIRRAGNEDTHSQKTICSSKEEYEEKLEAMNNIYAYMFFDFFKRYPFGTDKDIVSSFSLLPPILRYIVLRELFDKYPDNIDVIKKLPIALLKAEGYDNAIDQIEKDKEKYRDIQMPYSSEDLKEKICYYGWDNINIVMAEIQESVYDFLRRELDKVKEIENYPIKYKTLEEAEPYFTEHGLLNETSEEQKEFNSLMKYIYTGRHKDFNN